MTEHFGEYPDLVESFVLGRLDPVAMESYRHHAASCEDCARAVERERTIIEGIRSVGRGDLKKRLAHNALRARRDIWPAVYAAAAILVVMVGVGISEGWFAARNQSVEQPIVQTVPEVGKDAPAGKTEPAPSLSGSIRKAPQKEIGRINEEYFRSAPAPLLQEKGKTRVADELHTTGGRADAANRMETAASGAQPASKMTAAATTGQRIDIRYRGADDALMSLDKKAGTTKADARREDGRIVVTIDADSTRQAAARMIGNDSVIVTIGTELLRLPILP